jgi:hypothetical protein
MKENPGMAKAKSNATIMAADGSGGMAQVQDRRFDAGEWPIAFDVPKEQADTWLQYLSAESDKSGWSCSSFGQIDARENSGSVTINSGSGQPQLIVVWERKRGRFLRVRAKPAGSEFPLDQANEFLRQVNARSASHATVPFYRGWHLFYQGLPWRGELWLEPTLRLGPPSQQDERALIGSRIILVNALVNGIDQMHATSAFAVLLRELSVFLSVVMGTKVGVSPNGNQGWTWHQGSDGQVECEILNLGYWEKQLPADMPAQGQVPPVPLEQTPRPDFSLRGIDGSKTAHHLPHDVLDLWKAFAGLPAERRRQFLQAGNMWQIALGLGHENQTAGFAWMVAACEALKPHDPQYRDHNIYQVIEALLGREHADVLQEQWLRAQDVRNAHFHRGEFKGSEFIEHLMMSSFQDPTFDCACRALHYITRAALIEWLLRSGTFTMPALNRKRTWRRWIKDQAITLVPFAAGVGAAMGIAMGWFLARGW